MWVDIISKNLKRKISKLTGSGLTLKSNEIKCITKAIRYLENRRILSKGITGKITSKEAAFLIFFKPIMSVALPLMKNIPTQLAKSVLVPLSASATDAVIQKKMYGLGTATLVFPSEDFYP